MKLQELDVEAYFPKEMKRLSEILVVVDQSNQLKTHFSSNIAESINNLKAFIVKAEASLMISDM